MRPKGLSRYASLELMWSASHESCQRQLVSYYSFWSESGLWDHTLAQALDRLLRGGVVYGVSLWSGASVIEVASTRLALSLRLGALASNWGPRAGDMLLWLVYASFLGWLFWGGFGW